MNLKSLQQEPQLRHISCPEPLGTHRMAYWQWGQADSPHVVVCVHGLTRQGRDFDVLARSLLGKAPYPLRVVCPDVVGRGQSDHLQDPTQYQVPVYAADMRVLLEQLQQDAPVQTLDWVGTSMGGLIGLVLWGQEQIPAPLPLHKLVLNDVGPTLAWQALVRISQYVGKTGWFATPEKAAEALWLNSTSFGPHTQEQWLALSKPMLKPVQDGGWTLHYDPALAVPFAHLTAESVRESEVLLWQLYQHITAPTLLLRGAQSDLLSVETAHAMTQQGPRAQLVQFEGVGHAPTLVADNQVDAVASFLFCHKKL